MFIVIANFKLYFKLKRSRFSLTKPLFRTGLTGETHQLNITQDYLVDLFSVATKHRLFQYNGHLYEQIDRVAMGSPLGPLMANVFMCSIEEKLKSQNKLPYFYRRYVDDTRYSYLTTLTEAHSSINFTMETATNNKLPFVGMEIEMKRYQLATHVLTEKQSTKASYCGIKVTSTISVNTHSSKRC